MKPRERRRTVMLSARMRSAASWHDACILNLSSRGLMLQTEVPPERGAYLEVRRGPHVIVARVIWTRQQRVGLKAQDPLPVEAIVRQQATAVSAAAKPVERRQSPRSSQRAQERSREHARTIQGIALTLGGIAAAALAVASIQQALGHSLGQVGAALAASER